MIYFSILLSLITLADCDNLRAEGIPSIIILVLSVLYVIVTIPSSFGWLNCRDIWKYRKYSHLLKRGSPRPSTKDECIGVIHLCEALLNSMDMVVRNKRTFTMICFLNPILIPIWGVITSYTMPDLDRCCRIAATQYTEVGELV